MDTLRPLHPNSIYQTADIPEDHVKACYEKASESGKIAAKESYGLDSPLGFAMSGVAAPLYLYASLKGKSDLWDRLLAAVPDEQMRQPSLDVGCGRGLVLLKVAKRKAALAASEHSNDTLPEKAYGVDIFVKGDQSGNSPEMTTNNAMVLDVVHWVVLHTASFAEELPFADAAFGVVTASLSLHNVSANGRETAIREIIRICRPGAKLLIVDLGGYVSGYRKWLEAAGWDKQEIKITWAGPGVMYGMWPVQVLSAQCP